MSYLRGEPYVYAGEWGDGRAYLHLSGMHGSVQIDMASAEDLAIMLVAELLDEDRFQEAVRRVLITRDGNTGHEAVARLCGTEDAMTALLERFRAEGAQVRAMAPAEVAERLRREQARRELGERAAALRWEQLHPPRRVRGPLAYAIAKLAAAIDAIARRLDPEGASRPAMEALEREILAARRR